MKSWHQRLGQGLAACGVLAVVVAFLWHALSCSQCEASSAHTYAQSSRTTATTVAQAIATAHKYVTNVASDAGKKSPVIAVEQAPQVSLLVATNNENPRFSDPDSRNSALAHRAVTVLLI